jgi:hypothetical protein
MREPRRHLSPGFEKGSGMKPCTNEITFKGFVTKPLYFSALSNGICEDFDTDCWALMNTELFDRVRFWLEHERYDLHDSYIDWYYEFEGFPYLSTTMKWLGSRLTANQFEDFISFVEFVIEEEN